MARYRVRLFYKVDDSLTLHTEQQRREFYLAFSEASKDFDGVAINHKVLTPEVEIVGILEATSMGAAVDTFSEAIDSVLTNAFSEYRFKLQITKVQEAQLSTRRN